MDKTVKLWNLNEKSLELYKKYEHPGAVYAVEGHGRVAEDHRGWEKFSSIYIWSLPR